MSMFVTTLILYEVKIILVISGRNTISFQKLLYLVKIIFPILKCTSKRDGKRVVLFT